MATDVVRLSRRELYDRVWSTPVSRLATEFGISNVGLAKICDRHQIPRPGLGHWAKKRNGHTVRRTPLPRVDDGELETVCISATERTEDPQVADEEIAELIRAESEPQSQILVPDRLQIRNQFVRATRGALRGSKPNEYGRVSPDFRCSEPHFDVQVSPPNVSRALRICEGLTRGLEQRGHSLRAAEGDRHPYVAMLGEELAITVRESSKRSQTPEAKRDRWYSPRCYYKPTGILELSVNYRTYSTDGTLRDTKRKPLQKRLNEVVVLMLRIVDRRRTQAAAARIKAAKKAERKRVAVEQEVERRSDSVRVERLRELTQEWERHQRLSAFVEAVRRAIDSLGTGVDPDATRWLSWADQFLDASDPLAGGTRLPSYALSADEVEGLRRECDLDWKEWSGSFVGSGSATPTKRQKPR